MVRLVNFKLNLTFLDAFGLNNSNFTIIVQFSFFYIYIVNMNVFTVLLILQCPMFVLVYSFRGRNFSKVYFLYGK